MAALRAEFDQNEQLYKEKVRNTVPVPLLILCVLLVCRLHALFLCSTTACTRTPTRPHVQVRKLEAERTSGEQELTRVRNQALQDRLVLEDHMTAVRQRMKAEEVRALVELSASSACRFSPSVK